MENTAEYNSAYSYVISEINSILMESQKPFASDNKLIRTDINKVKMLVDKLYDACETFAIYENTEYMIKLKNEIQQSKK